MQDAGVLDRLLKSSRLPSLPSVAIEILNLLQQEDVDIRAIARAVSHDTALSAKILKTVNSSYYGQQRQISTISEALVVLGLRGIKTLALGFALVGKLTPPAGGGFDHVWFWRRSVYTAVAGRAIAKHLGLVQQEEAFLAGLLQDLGILAMVHVLGEPYQRIVSQAGSEHDALLALEREKLDVDHSQVGGALAESWNLPRLLCEPIRFHAHPECGPEDLRTLTRCVALGGDVADMLIDSASGRSLLSYQDRARTWFGMDRAEYEYLLTTIHQETVVVSNLFELPADQMDSPEVILSRANEVVVHMNLQQQQETDRLEQQNKHLAAQLVTDALTGVANRRGLDEHVKKQFELARSAGRFLSLLFLDIDDFKAVNDNHGHHVGDCALISLTKTTQDMVAQTNCVARFGGDEFAVVLPDVDRTAAARLAERIRQRVAATTIESDDKDKPVRITISIGVATYESGCFTGEKQLFLAADQALYTAKGDGRDCVRVYQSVPATQPGVKSKAS